MLTLKVENQAIPTGPVYSDWGLSPALGSLSLGSSVEVLANGELKVSSFIEENKHNNTISFTHGSAQMASYSPIEDKLFVSDEDNLFAIFDGHGGDICSRYIVDRLPKQLLSALHTRKATTEADFTAVVKTTFTKVDEQFLNEHKHVVRTSASGSCGVTVLVRNNSLIIGNLGDSRVLLGSKTHTWEHELLTNDHNTKNEKERQLVKQRTADPMPIRGHVTNKIEGERVGGVLMVTRAFGDGIFKRRDMSLAPFIPYLPYITNEPEVTIRKISPSDRYAVISSDGLYEYLTPPLVAAYVEQQLEITTDGKKIAAGLIELLFEKVAKLAEKTVEQIKAIPNRKEFLDDTTVIVLVFSSPVPLGAAAK